MSDSLTHLLTLNLKARDASASKNDQNCQKWSKSPKMVKIAKNGQNGLKWSKMVQNSSKWSKMVQNGEKW